MDSSRLEEKREDKEISTTLDLVEIILRAKRYKSCRHNNVDSCAKIFKSTKIGRGCFIDGYINILPRVTIGDYTTIYTFSHVGHDTVIGKNCAIQRYCAVPSYSIMEDNVFFGSGTKALKDKTIYKQGTFVHEGIYLRRSTIENEVVSMYGSNTKRVVSQYVD